MKIRIPSAAYHEAGHAVAAVLLGMHVTVASIEVKGYPRHWRLRGGVLASFDHSGAQNRREAERAVTAGLAGEQAELLWSMQKPWRRVKSTSHERFAGDRAYVEEMLRPFIRARGDKRRTVARLKEASRTLLEEHWSRVEAVAEKLAERKALNGREINRVVAQTG
jgi:ATP-dependent Zn protease